MNILGYKVLTQILWSGIICVTAPQCNHGKSVSSNLTIASFLCMRTCLTTLTNSSYMGEPAFNKEGRAPHKHNTMANRHIHYESNPSGIFILPYKFPNPHNFKTTHPEVTKISWCGMLKSSPLPQHTHPHTH